MKKIVLLMFLIVGCIFASTFDHDLKTATSTSWGDTGDYPVIALNVDDAAISQILQGIPRSMRATGLNYNEKLAYNIEANACRVRGDCRSTGSGNPEVGWQNGIEL